MQPVIWLGLTRFWLMRETNYAAAALGIVDGVPDIFGDTVKDLWEKVDPGSVARSWDDVAAQHQSQYTELIELNSGALPEEVAPHF